MTNTKPTPGPWNTTPRAKTGRLSYISAKHEIIADAIQTANAAHIVKCVNAYEPMLEALKAFKDAALADEPEPWDKLYAAIKLAEGE